MTSSENIHDKIKALGLWFWVTVSAGLLIMCGYILYVSPSFFGDDMLLVGHSEYFVCEEDKICLNHAVKEQLIMLPGIGDIKAQAIIDFRNTNGGFRTTSDLLLVEGITDKIFVEIENEITV